MIAEQRVRAVTRGQSRGQSMTAALQQYRRYGGRISRERWRELWREIGQQERSPGLQPPTIGRRVKQPGGYLYHVQLVLGEPKTGRARTMWFAVKFPRRVKPSRAVGEAMRLYQGFRDNRGYGYVVLGGYVSSIEHLIGEDV